MSVIELVIMATNPVFSAIVPEVLIEENYATWSVCIQNYLLSQDLWDIIETESTSIENTSEVDRRKKNATALHAIQISCGSKLLHHIKGYKSAKGAWDFLAKKCSRQIQRGSLIFREKEVVEELVGQASHRLSSALSRTDWLNSITGAKEKKARTNQSQTPMLIRKVPPILRKEGFKTCYEPSVVSIGPYHHNCYPRLQQVEELKPLIAKKFVHLLAAESEGVVEFFDQFEKEFNKIINPGIKGLYDITGCFYQFYDENVTNYIGEEEFKEEFTRMMFLDGCFILYFIFCILIYEVERIGLKNHLIALVQQDLFLAENQLPFQVLKTLMSLTDLRTDGMIMLEEFTEDMNTCGRPIWMRYQQVRIEETPPPPLPPPRHLLDILWIKLLGNYEEINNEFEVELLVNNEEINNEVENKNHIKRHLFHGVKELTAAGIHFRPNSSGSLRDIKFRSYDIYGTLTLPRMTIERSTRQMFLNLIAHEACMDNPKKFGFTSYICFLDLLIDHAEDVKALRTAGILVNYLDSDEEVANLFNEIASDLLPEVDTYKEVKYNIEHYLGEKGKVKIASWVAEVIRDHFKSPWKTIALLAGIIVISLAFLQTYFTIFPR